MLIDRESTPTFLLNIYLHAAFTFSISVILFFALDINSYKNDLNEKVKDVIDNSDTFDNITSTDKPDDRNKLDTLQSIYDNDSYYDKELNSNVKNFTIAKLFIILFSFLIKLIIVNKEYGFYKKLFIDKITYFIILGCLIYAFYYFVEKDYVDVFREDIQEELTEGLRS